MILAHERTSSGLVVVCLTLCACSRAPRAEVDAGVAVIAAPDAGTGLAVVWPPSLFEGLVSVDVRRVDADGGVRTARVEQTEGGLWLITAPRRGEADPLALSRLKLGLNEPQVQGARGGTPKLRVDAEYWLHHLDGGTDHVQVELPVPGQTVQVAIENVGQFTVSGVELPTRLPDPEDFLPPGLWVSAQYTARSIEVRAGKRVYRLEGEGEDWKAVKGRVGKHDLDDVVGVIVGRQAAGHPATGTPLGLDPPDAVATLCAGTVCRAFRFGHAGAHFYAQGPDADPIELRDNDWKLLVAGP